MITKSWLGKIIKSMAVVVSSIAIISCSSMLESNPDEIMNAYTSFGTIDGISGVITQDSGDVLNIVELGEQLKNEDIANLSGRIFFNYTILDGVALNEYNVRLNCIYQLHIEDVKVLSKMSADEIKELGEDPISPLQATVSGGYVNVQLYYMEKVSAPKSFVHDVDLIFDDTNSSEETMVLMLRHKGDGADPTIQQCNGIYQWVSFKLTDDIVDYYTSKDPTSDIIRHLLVVFHWNWWNDDGEIQNFTGSMQPVPYSGVYNDDSDITKAPLATPLLME